MYSRQNFNQNSFFVRRECFESLGYFFIENNLSFHQLQPVFGFGNNLLKMKPVWCLLIFAHLSLAQLNFPGQTSSGSGNSNRFNSNSQSKYLTKYIKEENR